MPSALFRPGDVDPPPGSKSYTVYATLGVVALLVAFGVGVVVSRKRRHEHGRLWLPEGFLPGDTSKKKRREPVGEDSVGLKPLKTTSDLSLMDDGQTEWGDEDPSDAKRFRQQFEDQAVLELSEQTDRRRWTQQHLDAADLRVPSLAPTPPQGEADSDCMDVNVRGPGWFSAMHVELISSGIVR
ncbi:hypothetical protein CRUP_003402 [Coryphaenoides rupestris]|nr:hypothetical protein CRUP_003402 [Coryphaenoides rupestris]